MPKKIEPSVYIIIVNWNGIDDTIECLQSLEKISYTNYKIVLVDNGSKNCQGDLIKKTFPHIKLIKNKNNTGFCIANNQGIKLAIKEKADYVLLLNNDTVVSKDFLGYLVKYQENHCKIGITTPKILYYKTNLIWAFGGKIFKYLGISINIGKGKKSKYFTKIIEPDYASGCALLIKNDVIKSVGQLDPIYFAYYEDADLGFRVRKLGYRIIAIPKSIIWHKKSASAGVRGKNKFSPLQCYYQTRNSIIFSKKFLNSPQKIIFFISLFLFKIPFTTIHSQNINCIIKVMKGLIDGIKTNTIYYENYK